MAMAEKTTQEQLKEGLAGRLEDFRDFAKRLASDDDEVSEAASEELNEYPLGMTEYRVVRIDLSTGGPGDWLEVQLDGDEPRRIEYHFAPWFDHASVVLDGDDFEAADMFCRHLTGDYYYEPSDSKAW